MDNGLKVLTCENHDIPVVSFWAWYRTGSRNEPPGLAGASHFLEHMLFKSTTTDPRSEIMRRVARVGGVANAFTSRDFTCYYETLPAAHLDLALRIERARLDSVIEREAFESERTVVLSEKEGADNSPHTLLGEALEAKAFRKHPYGRPVIGLRADLLKMRPADLQRYFAAHYVPSKTLLVAVGDFNTRALLRKIERLWGAQAEPRRRLKPETIEHEPPQRAERRLLLKRPGGAAYVEVLYKGPAAGDPCVYPLLIADALLSGGKSFVGSNYTDYRTSRMYSALVRSGLASSAHSYYTPSVDPFGLTIGATATSPGKKEKIEDALLGLLDRFAGERLADADLARAITQLKAAQAYSLESTSGLAVQLGYAEMVGGHHLLREHLDRLQSVTAGDVMRAAAKYLVSRNRTVGWFVPSGPSYVAEGAPAEPGGPKVFAFTGFKPMARIITDNGAAVLAAENKASPSVVIHGSLPAGTVYDTQEKAGLAHLTADVIVRGTRKKTYEQIFTQVDSLGASLNVSGGLHHASFHIKCLAEHWPGMFDMLLDILRQPAFPEEHVELVRAMNDNQLRQVDDSPQHVANRELHHLIYPVGHPYHHYPLGYHHTLRKLKRADLRRFHDACYAPERSIFCITGGTDARAAAERMARKIERWRKRRKTPANVDATVAPRTSPQRRDLAMKQKQQAEIVLGFKGPARISADFMTMEQLTQITGGLGLMGRLGHFIRERQGLAYYAYASFAPAMGEYPWTVHAGVNPANIERTVESILAVLRQVRERPVSRHELADTQGYLIGSVPLRLETNEGRAGILHYMECYGLGENYVERYPTYVRNVTAADILAAAQRHIHIDGYTLVVVRPEG